MLRALALGDLLAAVPALRGVRAALPGHRVVLAAPAAMDPVLRASAAYDEIVDIRGLEDVDALETVGPVALAVNLHGSGPRSHQVLAALSPGRLVAYAGDGWPEGPAWRAQEHEVDRWCRLVSSALGPCNPGALDLAPPAVAAPVVGATVVHPGAGFGSRRWPLDRYAAVARALAARGHDVVETGSEPERADALAVAEQAGLDASVVLAGRTSLAELAALVASARLLVSGDTGISHLATAYATASVVLFGPAPPARWAPRNRVRHVVLWHGDPQDPWAEGAVFGARPDPVLLKIDIEQVLVACEQALRGSRTT